MTWKQWSYRIAGLLTTAAYLWIISSRQNLPVYAASGQSQNPAQNSAQDPAAAQPESELVIKTDSALPDTHVAVPYEVRLLAAGGTPVLHWGLERGVLPSGIKLRDDGVISGTARQGGEFQFTVVAYDSGAPQQRKRKDFTLHVLSALSLVWKSVAHVNGNRIEGSVQVSNSSSDDIDLTFYVLAVAGNGRATAIGYQHFPLLKGTVNMELPFGDTLPRGGYVVHVDAVGEVAPKNVIYRESMETPKALQVAVGP